MVTKEESLLNRHEQNQEGSVEQNLESITPAEVDRAFTAAIGEVKNVTPQITEHIISTHHTELNGFRDIITPETTSYVADVDREFTASTADLRGLTEKKLYEINESPETHALARAREELAFESVHDPKSIEHQEAKKVDFDKVLTEAEDYSKQQESEKKYAHNTPYTQKDLDDLAEAVRVFKGGKPRKIEVTTETEAQPDTVSYHTLKEDVDTSLDTFVTKNEEEVENSETPETQEVSETAKDVEKITSSGEFKEKPKTFTKFLEAWNIIMKDNPLLKDIPKLQKLEFDQKVFDTLNHRHNQIDPKTSPIKLIQFQNYIYRSIEPKQMAKHKSKIDEAVNRFEDVMNVLNS